MELSHNTATTSKRERQFSLARMLIFVAITGVMLASVRVAGWAATHFVAITVLFLVPFLWHPRWLYIWILPLAWIPTALRNFEHCGDEYGGFVIGSIAAFWIAPLFSLLKVSSPREMLPIVLAAGAASMMLGGAILDRLRLRWAIWFVGWLAVSIWLYTTWFGSFPSAERALGKNGSYDTYILTSINFGLTAATILGIAATAIYRFTGWVRSQSPRDRSQRDNS